MSLADAGSPGPQPGTAALAPTRDDRAVALWLLVCCALIFAMAVIGAVTRLTESGLSIMEWAPLSGVLPPLGQAEWERLFALYKRIPEYQELNRGMSLAEFREIFWWEYVHRLWGRMVALAFLLPLLWFWLRGRLRPGLALHLWAIFALGALQGLLGWYMVASGLSERIDVSQYRLVAHLLLALAIYAYALWIALGLLDPRMPSRAGRPGGGLRRGLLALTALLVLTIASGGLVAGLNAGLVYNTFPFMGAGVVPEDYGALSPWFANPFENPSAAQFNHRLLAIASLLGALAAWPLARAAGAPPGVRRACGLLAAAATAQVALGVATLLLVVPVWLGALHQAGALALLTAALWALHSVRPAAGKIPCAARATKV